MEKQLNELLRNAIAEGSPESAIQTLKQTATQNQLNDITKYLLEFYEKAPSLLHEFFNHKSDATDLEAVSAEKLENDFRTYIIIKYP